MPERVPSVDADRVIGEEYEAFKGEVVQTVAGKLAASKINFAPLDMDGFYNQAWFGLWTKLSDGQQVENRMGLLVQMTYRRAIDEYRTLHPDRHADPVVLETLGREDPIEETLDQQQEFRQFVEGMRSSLSQRELRAATLCYVYGFSRPEAAEQVGVTPKRMEKIMDEVSRKLRPVLSSIKQGSFCEDRAVLINQYALGALSPDSPEHESAVHHLEGCPGCRRHVLGTRGLTAVTIPSGILLLALTGTAAAAATAATASAAGGAGTSAGAGSGGATAAGGAGFGAAAQVAAVVAAVAAVAAGGYVAADRISNSGDDTPQATKPATAPASPSSTQPSEPKQQAKKPQPKKQQKPEPAATPEPPPPPPAPATTPEPTPKYTPANPSIDSGAEFDLQ